MTTARKWVSVATLAVYASFEAYTALVTDGWTSFCYLVFTAAVAVAAFGVARRVFWARWLALGIGVTGLSSVIAPLLDAPHRFELWAFAVLPGTVLAALSGRQMARYFAERAPELWQRADWRLKVLGLAIIGAVPAAAGLLLHAEASAWWIEPHERVVAVVSAALLAGGAIAALARRTVGLLVMFAAACAGLGLAIESLFRLARPHFGMCGLAWFDRAFIEVTLATFVPGALASVAALAVFGPAIARYLRRPLG